MTPHFSFSVCFDPQVQKKAFIENTVPLIISLKSLLEQKRSPVLRDLMTYLQVRHDEHCWGVTTTGLPWHFQVDVRKWCQTHCLML